jgi:hypothetical protein
MVIEPRMTLPVLIVAMLVVLILVEAGLIVVILILSTVLCLHCATGSSEKEQHITYHP